MSPRSPTVANWADQIRTQHPETAPWHFADIPISAASYAERRDCPRHNCIIAKIEDFTAELRDERLPATERLAALKFVVHFIGDLHQPLHASNNNDHGANDIRVLFDGHRTNLHAVWDTYLLAPVAQGDDRAYALSLSKSITPDQLALWQSGSIVDWANESHGVAARLIYGALDHEPGAFSASYRSAAIPIINEQLEKAGVRLAYVLNQVLAMPAMR